MTIPSPPEPRVSLEKVRHLTAEELGLVLKPAISQSKPAEALPIDDDDPILATVLDLLDSYGGIIFQGPPGTSKSWYAARVGMKLVDGDSSRIRFVQFHPSYQYEDFVEGFVPSVNGGFQLTPKHFLALCREAMKHPDQVYVLVIDELSRGDPGRVFGEALTYVERSKRNLAFSLASGTECRVPHNFTILATMNPLDRGVDEVDAALERRFAKIALEPDGAVLTRFLGDSGMADALRGRVLTFFTRVNERSKSNPFAALGHTYFVGIADEDGLHRLWEHQLRFHFDKAYRLDADGLAEIYRLWNQVLAVQAPDPVAGDPGDAGFEINIGGATP